VRDIKNAQKNFIEDAFLVVNGPSYLKADFRRLANISPARAVNRASKHRNVPEAKPSFGWLFGPRLLINTLKGYHRFCQYVEEKAQ
jgi:hypothetical protein